MKEGGYILTGLRVMRDRSHSPVILDHGTTAARFDQAAARFQGFEQFNVFPATKAALRRIARNAAQGGSRHLVIDDLTVWPRPKSLGGSIICTPLDHMLAKALKNISARIAQTVRPIAALTRLKPAALTLGGKS